MTEPSGGLFVPLFSISVFYLDLKWGSLHIPVLSFPFLCQSLRLGSTGASAQGLALSLGATCRAIQGGISLARLYVWKHCANERWWWKERGAIITALAFFSSRSGGQIYLFPWKLRWNFTDYFAVMMRDISGHKFLLPFVRQWWTIFYLAFKDVTWYLYGSGVICNDIHFIVSYNPVEKLKVKLTGVHALHIQLELLK